MDRPFGSGMLGSVFPEFNSGQSGQHPLPPGSGLSHNTNLDHLKIENKDKRDIHPAIDFSSLSWRDVEEQYIHFILKRNNWNVTWAAKDAGLNRSTFASRMRRLGIKRAKRGHHIK